MKFLRRLLAKLWLRRKRTPQELFELFVAETDPARTRTEKLVAWNWLCLERGHPDLILDEEDQPS